LLLPDGRTPTLRLAPGLGLKSAAGARARGSITARDCPHIAEEFLAEEREGMSEWQFRAEYLCEFTETDEAFFSSELCDAMIDKTLEAWA
jgi:hypothetical protein